MHGSPRLRVAGFVPGVGAKAILAGDELFWRLTTKHYWKSGSRVPDIPSRLSAHSDDHRQRQGRRCCNRPQLHQERQLWRLCAVAVRELNRTRVSEEPSEAPTVSLHG